MKTVTIPIQIPADVMLALNESQQDLKSHLQVAIAVLFFQEGKLTLGKAIQLSGVSRFEFEKALARNKVPIADIDFEQAMADADKLKDL
jgi:predicted HTH domain antitoxin